MRVSVRIKIRIRVRLGIRVRFRVSVKIRIRIRVRLGIRVRFRISYVFSPKNVLFNVLLVKPKNSYQCITWPVNKDARAQR